MKVCLEPGCPTLTTTSRCERHMREREQARGSSAARGYGATHQAERKRWQPKVKAGAIRCWRCGGPLDPDDWTLGHCDDDRSIHHGPECPPCDYATAGRTRCPHPSHADARGVPQGASRAS